MLHKFKGEFGEEFGVGDCIMFIARSGCNYRHRVGLVTKVEPDGSTFKVTLKSKGSKYVYNYDTRKGEYIDAIYTNRIYNFSTAVRVDRDKLGFGVHEV